jgi:elongation factor 1-beta
MALTNMTKPSFCIVGWDIMGEVICVYRIMPERPEDLEYVKKRLEGMNPARLEEEPIGFGVVALKFTIIIKDGPGELEVLEERLGRIEKIGSCENIMTTRAL